MTVYIDADACPVTRIAERVAKEYGVPVVQLMSCESSSSYCLRMLSPTVAMTLLQVFSSLRPRLR